MFKNTDRLCPWDFKLVEPDGVNFKPYSLSEIKMNKTSWDITVDISYSNRYSFYLNASAQRSWTIKHYYIFICGEEEVEIIGDEQQEIIYDESTDYFIPARTMKTGFTTNYPDRCQVRNYSITFEKGWDKG